MSQSSKKVKNQVASLDQLVKQNLGPGIVVSLVSIPLSTALAMASGCTPMMGLSTAVYGSAIGGLLGGSDYNILGPAGALVNILSSLVGEYGVEIIPWIAIVSGLMSLAVWAVKFEKYCCLIPNSVLEGFSMGVGITIGSGQLNFALGLDDPNPPKEFYKKIMWSFSNIGNLDPVIFVPFFLFFGALFSLMKFKPGRPWIILIAFLGNIYGILTNKAFTGARPLLLQDKFPEMDKYGADIINF